MPFPKVYFHRESPQKNSDDFFVELADFVLVELQHEYDFEDYSPVSRNYGYRLPDCLWVQVVKIADQQCFYVADGWQRAASDLPKPIKIRREDVLAYKKYKPKVLKNDFDEYLYTPRFLSENQEMIEQLIQ